LKKLLLDTHILLWWLNNDRRLSETIRILISDPENLIYVSVASLWEATIKRKLGTLEFADELLFRELSKDDWQVLPITLQHALTAGSLPLYHQDPFDRMLVAQAIHEGLTLVTHDNWLKYYEAPIIWG